MYNSTTGAYELDFLTSNLNDYKLQYQPMYYRIISPDFMRPDLISYKVYGTVDYWWVICLFNQIQNPFEELEMGTLLQMPNTVDIYNFSQSKQARSS